MTVFANKLEVSCKAQANKVVAAFPDVCFTPPQTPATPPGVPIPYPNFGLDDDTAKGTSTVKIGNKTVNQKNASYFSKTTGDEAGCAPKKGVITSKITGKAYSTMWSMNVKAQGKPLTRFSDIGTDNHGSIPGNTPPWPKIGKPHLVNGKDPCEGDKAEIEKACKDKDIEDVCKEAGLNTSDGVDNKTRPSDAIMVYDTTGGAKVTKKNKAASALKDNESRINKERMTDYGAAQRNDCLKALRCKLVTKKEADDGACCGKQTGHHMVPESGFMDASDTKLAGCSKYDEMAAPCICAEGASHNKGSHGLMHNDMYCEILDKTGGASSPTNTTLKTSAAGGKTAKSLECRSMTYKQMRDKAVSSVAKVFPSSDCSPACLKAQIDNYHNNAGIKDGTKLRADPTPGRPPAEAKRMMDNIAAVNKKAKAMAAAAGR